MPDQHFIIPGQKFEDHRGSVMSANTFDMTQVKRHYIVTHNNNETIRGWQGHKTETKWIKCIEGSFCVNLVRPFDIDVPVGKEEVVALTLHAGTGHVLFVAGGYFTAFRCLTDQGSLLIFSDKFLEESQADDYRKPIDFWQFKMMEE